MKAYLEALKEELFDFDTNWIRFTAICIRIFVLCWVIAVPFVWSIKHL